MALTKTELDLIELLAGLKAGKGTAQGVLGYLETKEMQQEMIGWLITEIEMGRMPKSGEIVHKTIEIFEAHGGISDELE